MSYEDGRPVKDTKGRARSVKGGYTSALVGVNLFQLKHRVINGINLNSAHIHSVQYIYFTVLVTLTQRLGLLRVLHRRQHVTTLPDASSAWSGLGSALTGLWYNVYAPASILSSIIITT
ncbi:hypothetical protein CONPUDRAFT_77881 [Coniophora puteana RWD-64-598 SS2]|uniref:Uncharacterized protein n=1 Tax=Coniophora puteana (strain RWD-64-598) TaxID=741705 RepID=R7SEJ0_CONPW|nr:uncharacterized protein CONPUDRAFT_77881 [Coniophora puteana RWD-64-598 SS2]EIW74593.1 hypothetical protein CONPUDRAFT_77881 [Coniophora puteana RWD-64-598 SS2]